MAVGVGTLSVMVKHLFIQGNSQHNGPTVTDSRLPSDGQSQIGRIFIGCENYTSVPGQGKHIFVPLKSMHDPVTIIKMWGKDRCRVKKEMLEALKINWDTIEEGMFERVALANSSGFGPQVCYAVFANTQGPKDNLCPYFHSVPGQPRGQRGKIQQCACDVTFHFFFPKISVDKETGEKTASTTYAAILSYGEHTHPPPPAIRLPHNVKVELIDAVRKHGNVNDITARRLIASPVFSILTNGNTELDAEHIALYNFDQVNNIFRKERLKEHPWGGDFLGAQYLQDRQGDENPYIRSIECYSDKQFIIVCQFRDQSRLFFEANEIQIDKTFRRTDCHELEINAFDHTTHTLVTLARVFTNYETAAGYYKAFSKVFGLAEEDMKKKLRWGHLYDDSQTRIKAVLMDMHAGQVKGLGLYFANEYKQHDMDWHISRIVKTCQVHYQRSIHELKRDGVPESIPLL